MIRYVSQYLSRYTIRIANCKIAMFNAYNVTLLIKQDKCAMTLIIEFVGAYLTRIWSYDESVETRRP